MSEVGGKPADEVALELLKQIITLSVAVLAFTGTFLDNVDVGSRWTLWVLVAAWFGFIVAIGASLRSISAIVKARLNPDFDWSTGAGRRFAQVGQFGFAAGLVLFLVFAAAGVFQAA